MHKVDTVLEDLGFAPEGCGGSCLVFGNLNGGKHRAVHSLEGHEIAPESTTAMFIFQFRFFASATAA